MEWWLLYRDAPAMMALAEAGQRLRGGAQGWGRPRSGLAEEDVPQPGGVGGAGRVGAGKSSI